MYILIIIYIRIHKGTNRQDSIYRYYNLHTRTNTHIHMIDRMCIHDISLQDLLMVSLSRLRSWPKLAPHVKPSLWSTGCDGHVHLWSQVEGPDEPGILSLFTHEKVGLPFYPWKMWIEASYVWI
jgi:hypothetical protein